MTSCDSELRQSYDKSCDILGADYGNFLGVNLGSDGFVFRERIEEIERNEVLPRLILSA